MKSYFGEDWGGGFFSGRQGRFRAHRGDMSAIVLRVLEEKPMHGYEIIRTLEERSHGFWRPSAGSIYPTLQMLEEEDMVTSSEVNGKKIYTITEKGRASFAEQSPESNRWEGRQKNMHHYREIAHQFREIMGTFKDVVSHGSEEQIKELTEVMSETQRKLAEIAAKVRK